MKRELRESGFTRKARIVVRLTDHRENDYLRL